MHQLKALIWKAYRVRLRSPFTTALDLGGPIVTIIIYLALKVLMGALSVPVDSDPSSSISFFSKPAANLLDPSRDLKQHVCNKVLFFASGQIDQSIGQTIGARCGLELITMSSGDELIAKLQSSLIKRINYKSFDTDLNRSNATTTTTSNCYNLAGDPEPSYEAGIIIEPGRVRVCMTDSADNPVIYQPYTQGSPFNEHRFPQSDLNSGYHLFEICIADALNSIKSRVRRQISNISGLNQPIEPIEISSKLKWRIRAFPETATPQLIIFIFMTFQLAANLCNAAATVMRVADNNESGLHHYIRSAGVSASVYWGAQVLTVVIHMVVQSLIMAILLSIPTSSVLCDPIFEANITVRWMLILTYSIAINAHAMFVGSLFSRTSHALLVTCLLAVAYAMYPLFFMLQWSPYAFSNLKYLSSFFILSNPVSNYEALLMVIYGVYVHTNEPLNLDQLHLGILGGGINDWSLGSLWLALIIQAIVWLFFTVLFDHWRYSSSRNMFTFPLALVHEFFCCNKCAPKIDDDREQVQSRITDFKAAKSTKTAGPVLGNAKSTKSTKSQVKDPNRICCSLRDFTVHGPSISTAYTKNDALKLTSDELNKLHQFERDNVSKTHQYIINRSSPRSAATVKTPNNSAELKKTETTFLDEAIQQNIVWKKSDICLNNLNLDFRFNQVSFILGQTDLKELFFAALMGLRVLSSGCISLEGIEFRPCSMSFARRYIGHLGERDIFIQDMTIFENLQFFGSLRDPAYTQFDSESSYLLSLLHLTRRKDNLPMILTTRSARKLSMAVAAVGHTKLLLLVEPTLSLNWRPRCHVLNLLKKYKSIRSILVDTSDVDEATAFGDRVLLLKDGRAFLDGPPARLAKKLSCGYWLYFDQVRSSKLSESHITDETLASLEKLTSDLFMEDKLEKLEVIKRPVYRELLRSDGSQLLLDKNKQEINKHGRATSEPADYTSRSAVLLKVRQSKH